MNSDERPLLFLDVDGVLNCLDAQVRTTEVRTEDRWGGHIAMVPFGTRTRIAELTEAFEPVWATAWQGMAHGHFRKHLRLPRESWPYVRYDNFKLTEILRYAAQRRWAWVDDDAEWEIRSLGEYFRDFPGSLVVNPDPRIGLTDEHVTRLLAFASKAP
jgi:hypothetical protein